MFFEIDAGFDDLNALGFEKLFLQGCVGLADEDLAVGAENAVPGNPFAPRSGTHGAARRASAACEMQYSSDGPIG